jgi:hypothetical protein
VEKLLGFRRLTADLIKTNVSASEPACVKYMGGYFTLVNWGQHVNHLYTYLTLDASDHLSYLGFTERSFVFGTNLSANCKVRWVISLEKREKEESLKSNLFTLSVPSVFILNCVYT